MSGNFPRHSSAAHRALRLPLPAKLQASSANSTGAPASFYEQRVRPPAGSQPPSETGRGAVVGMVLGGGPNDYTKLFPLTETRALPAVPVGGNYRLIDIPVSNLWNSGITKMYIITQYNSQSLNRHISQTYSIPGTASGKGSFIEVLSVSQYPGQYRWSFGTADSVRQFLWIIDDVRNRRDVSDVIILPADQLYRTDFAWMCEMHRMHAADITVLCQPVAEDKTEHMGICKVEGIDTEILQDGNGKAWWIVDFKEKPKGDAVQGFALTQEQLRQFKKTSVKAAAGSGDPRVVDKSMEIEEQKHIQPDAESKPYVGSTGIYIFRRKALVELLENKGDLNDFGSDVIPFAVHNGLAVQALQMEGSWRDVGGSVDDYHQASMDMARAGVLDIMEACSSKGHRGVSSNAPFFDPIAFKQLVYQAPQSLPPLRSLGSFKVSRSIISPGVTLGHNARIDSSIVGLRSVIGKGTVIQDSVVMGSDFYEKEKEQQSNPSHPSPTFPALGVGDASIIQKAIIDKNARIGKNVQLINAEGLYNSMNYASKGVYIREGIIVASKQAVIPDGTII